MSVSDEDLAAIQEGNDKLRAEIEEARGARATAESDAAREQKAAELLVETARLKAELNAAKAQAKYAEEGGGSQGISATTQSQLEAAMASLSATPGIPVDTNKPAEAPSAPKADKPSEGKKGEDN